MYYCTFVTSKTARRLIQSFYEDHAFSNSSISDLNTKIFSILCLWFEKCKSPKNIGILIYFKHEYIHIFCFVYTCKITKSEFVSSPLRGWTLNSTLQTSTLTSLWYFSYLSILSAFYWGCIFLHVSKTCCIVSDILVQKVQQPEE